MRLALSMPAFIASSSLRENPALKMSVVEAGSELKPEVAVAADAAPGRRPVP